MRYEWVEGFHARVDAATAGAVLESLRKANGGLLTPESVVREAAREDSPLYPQFALHEATAALQWRLSKARSLIRSLRVVEDERAARRFYVHTTVSEQRAYVTMEQMLADEGMRQQVLHERVYRARQCHLKTAIPKSALQRVKGFMIMRLIGTMAPRYLPENERSRRQSEAQLGKSHPHKGVPWSDSCRLKQQAKATAQPRADGRFTKKERIT